MKKIFQLVVIMLMMSLAAQSAYAQNEETVTDSLSTLLNSTGLDEAAEDALSTEAGSQGLNMNDLESLVTLLSKTTDDKEHTIPGTAPSLSVPRYKHRKINGHHMCQRLELSVVLDKSETSTDLANALFGGALSGKDSDAGEEMMDKLENKTGGLGIGANFGYSFVFIPGYQKEGSDELELNRFGFGYSVGFISQFDHEKNAGVTWDFLGKVGVEAGFQQVIGVGVDFLFGGGKTAQTVLDFTDVKDDDPQPEDLDITIESLWCAKLGTQLRINKAINNFEISIFTRFIYSIQPYSNQDKLNRMSVYDEIPIWQSEAWTVGVSVIYYLGSKKAANIPLGKNLLEQAIPL